MNEEVDFWIFSDESGKWNEGSYYIRSWIKISSSKYRLLRKEILFLKHETKIKELKWNHFGKNYDKLKDIFNVRFDVFITISIPYHLSKKPFKALDTLRQIEENEFTGNLELRKRLKQRAISSIKHMLFFNIYERQHIENVKGIFLRNSRLTRYKFMVDHPQCLDRDWRDIAKSVGINKVEIVKRSEEVPGIELADIIAGCIFNILKKKREAKEIYDELIKSKMVDMYSRKYPNPNLIFFGEFAKSERKILSLFR